MPSAPTRHTSIRSIRLTAEQVRYLRLRGSGLIDPFATPTEAAQTLVGIQAQILPAAGLALANRTPSLSHAELDMLLYADRSLVKLWGQRGTLHLYASDDWPLIHAARSIEQTWWARQLAGDDAASAEYRRLVKAVAELLAERDTIGRSDLRESDIPLSDGMLSPWGGIFAELVRQGYACHVARAGNEGRFAHRERWLPQLDWSPPSAEAANLTIARRYFQAYGPAALPDFAYWRAVPQRTAQAWVAALADELVDVEITDGDETGKPLKMAAASLATLPDTLPPPDAWPVHMLYRFDPLLLGQRDKSWVIPPRHDKRVRRPAGHIEGVVLDHGIAAATWRYERKGRTLNIRVQPFKRLPRYVTKQLPKLAAGVADFFDLALGDLTVARVAR